MTAKPRNPHRSVRVCRECGEPWPCPGAQLEPRCQAITHAGTQCTRAASPWPDGEIYCRAHRRRYEHEGRA